MTKVGHVGFDVIWLAVCVAVAIANIAGAIMNYWSAKRNRTIKAIERELKGLRSEIDGLKSNSSDNRRYQRRYRNDER